MQQFKEDILHWNDYDFVTINDDLQKCFDQIVEFINKKNKGNLSSHYDKKRIAQHIDYLKLNIFTFYKNITN